MMNEITGFFFLRVKGDHRHGENRRNGKVRLLHGPGPKRSFPLSSLRATDRVLLSPTCHDSRRFNLLLLHRHLSFLYMFFFFFVSILFHYEENRRRPMRLPHTIKWLMRRRESRRVSRLPFHRSAVISQGAIWHRTDTLGGVCV